MTLEEFKQLPIDEAFRQWQKAVAEQESSRAAVAQHVEELQKSIEEHRAAVREMKALRRCL
ncbi:MAG TPA: hypothetical protein VNT76_24255 [Candidatus Binatus sp.]|nr:hypothetical protein [Candidatus Binatus sp.]